VIFEIPTRDGRGPSLRQPTGGLRRLIGRVGQAAARGFDLRIGAP